jgi:SSS family solute:Na+ symporter
MLGLMAAALALVAAKHGGWTEAFGKALAAQPELFSRPGPRSTYTPAVWFSFLLLWLFCDPMFPQLFQRFYAARSPRQLGAVAVAYPAVCTVVFCLPVALGVLGRLDFPGLQGAAADDIVPLLAMGLGGEVLGALVLAAGLAALMSTMDSQLLTLGAMVSRDLLPRSSGRDAVRGRIVVVCLAVAGLVVAVGVDTTILQLGLTAFTGLAALLPTVLFGLLLAKPRAAAAWVSILLGQALAVGCHFKLLPTFGFLPAAPVIAASLGGYLIVQAPAGGLKVVGMGRRELAACAGMAGIFLLAQDYWRWREVGAMLLAWPLWAWWFVGLSAAQTALMWWWVRPQMRTPANGRGLPGGWEKEDHSQAERCIRPRGTQSPASGDGKGRIPRS